MKLDQTFFSNFRSGAPARRRMMTSPKPKPPLRPKPVSKSKLNIQSSEVIEKMQENASANMMVSLKMEVPIQQLLGWVFGTNQQNFLEDQVITAIQNVNMEDDINPASSSSRSLDIPAGTLTFFKLIFSKTILLFCNVKQILMWYIC